MNKIYRYANLLAKEGYPDAYIEKAIHTFFGLPIFIVGNSLYLSVA